MIWGIFKDTALFPSSFLSGRGWICATLVVQSCTTLVVEPRRGGMPRALHLTEVTPNPVEHVPILKGPSIPGMPIRVERLLPEQN